MTPEKPQGLLGKVREHVLYFSTSAIGLFLKLITFCLQQNLVFLGRPTGKKASLQRRAQGRPLATVRNSRVRPGLLSGEALETPTAASLRRRYHASPALLASSAVG